jgi:hypothetical protein
LLGLGFQRDYTPQKPVNECNRDVTPIAKPQVKSLLF